jgi:hypothetical protein
MDYIAELVGQGVEDASRGDAVAYSFATDRTDGFSDDDITTLRAVLPVVLLAMRAYAGHAIAAGPRSGTPSTTVRGPLAGQVDKHPAAGQ